MLQMGQYEQGPSPTCGIQHHVLLQADVIASVFKSSLISSI